MGGAGARGGGREAGEAQRGGRPPARATASPPPTTPLLLPAWPPSRRATTAGGAELEKGTRFGPVSPFGLSPCHAGERTVHSIELTVTQLGPDLSRRVMIPPGIDRGRTRGQDLPISMMLMSQKGAHRTIGMSAPQNPAAHQWQQPFRPVGRSRGGGDWGVSRGNRRLAAAAGGGRASTHQIGRQHAGIIASTVPGTKGCF